MSSKSTEDIVVGSALSVWTLNLGRFNQVLGKLTDAELMQQVAPGRNRAIYILGHLTAVSDALLPHMRFGSKLYPQLEETFITNPDDPALTHDTAELRAQWSTVNATLEQHFQSLTLEDWLSRHATVTEEDFAINPTRNRLSLLLNRTAHIGFHLGQLVFLIPPGSTRQRR